MRPISLSTHEKSFLIIHSTYFRSNVNTNSSLTTLFILFVRNVKASVTNVLRLELKKSSYTVDFGGSVILKDIILMAKDIKHRIQCISLL